MNKQMQKALPLLLGTGLSLLAAQSAWAQAPSAITTPLDSYVQASMGKIQPITSAPSLSVLQPVRGIAKTQVAVPQYQVRLGQQVEAADLEQINGTTAQLEAAARQEKEVQAKIKENQEKQRRFSFLAG